MGRNDCGVYAAVTLYTACSQLLIAPVGEGPADVARHGVTLWDGGALDADDPIHARAHVALAALEGRLSPTVYWRCARWQGWHPVADPNHSAGIGQQSEDEYVLHSMLRTRDSLTRGGPGFPPGVGVAVPRGYPLSQYLAAITALMRAALEGVARVEGLSDEEELPPASAHVELSGVRFVLTGASGDRPESPDRVWWRELAWLPGTTLGQARRALCALEAANLIE